MLEWKFVRRDFACVMIVTMGASIVGCGEDLYEPHLVNSLSEAVSFHLSDDAIIPYDRIKNQFKPDFKLGVGKDGKTVMSPGDGALARVLPTTGYYEQQVIQALSAALAIRLPTTTTSDETKTEHKDGKTSVTVNNTTTYATGTVPTIDDLGKVKPGADARAMTKIEALKTDDDKRKLDQSNPLLQYNLAAALVQEVAMLNTALDYIDGAGNSSYGTYILRLRVAMQPLAPNQPYNALVALGFFCVPESASGNPYPDYAARPTERTGFAKVYPLLVTDDLESTSTARSAQLITQLSVAITGMLGPTGFGGLFTSDRSKIRALLGKDLNSTFSISRTADNAVSVRLGAPRQPTAGYAMIPRNHSVSVVLQAPKTGCPFVNVTLAGSLRNANTGALVPDPEQPIIDATRAALHRLLESYANDKAKLAAAIKALPSAELKALTDSIQKSKYDEFYDKLERLLYSTFSGTIPDDRRKEVLVSWRSLWGRLAEVRSLSPYQNVSIRLPVQTGRQPGPPPASNATPKIIVEDR